MEWLFRVKKKKVYYVVTERKEGRKEGQKRKAEKLTWGKSPG